MPGQGTSEGRFLFELDGVNSIRASEVSGIELKHTPFKFNEGGRPNANVGRGNFECGEITVKQAQALNEAGSEFMRWMQDFIRGNDLTRRTARLCILDEDGVATVKEYELVNCVPTSFKVETQTAGGTNANFFSFMLQPEDLFEY